MTLRLGTFNVWGLPEIFGLGDDVTSRTREIARRLRHSDLDVLMIQEAWTDAVRTTLRAGARLAGFEVAEGPGSSGGLMTLSREPIRALRFERFGFRGDPERLGQGEFLGGKGFQTLEIETSAGVLSLVNTHLHARYRKERPRLNAAVRVAQLLQILRHLGDTPGTVVVGGDFNCSLGDMEYEIFEGLSGAIELGGGSKHSTLSTANYYKRHRTSEDKRIDFLFIRPEPGVEWQAKNARVLFAESAEIREIDRSLSDHFGFRAELDLAPGEKTAAFARGTHAPDRRALALARDLLSVGDAEADRRYGVHIENACAFVGLAAVTCGAQRVPSIDRRRFLRNGLGVLAWLCVAPAAGYAALAHFDSRGKRDAFAEARSVLTKLELAAVTSVEEGHSPA